MTIETGLWDFVIEKGSTFSYEIIWATDVCGTPMDLTNMTASLEARYKLTDASPFLDLTTENDGIIIDDDPETGKFVIFVSAEDTALLTAGNGVYDLQVNFNSGADVGYLLRGKMKVQEMVTR